MTDQKQPDSSELLKRALGAIDQLQAKLAKAEVAQHEPIAIIGMGCRFPGGADDPEALWRLLADGVDAVTEVPSDRWDVASIFDPDPDAAGKTYTKWGAFLKDLDMFDAPFFGITPREAANLDPQQRILLEMSWQALEDAGIAPSSVANTLTGVYVGIAGQDYANLLARNEGVEADAYSVSGTAHSIAGGRISYFLGAGGPNISVDTACSAAMVAIHLAVKGLRGGEADMALAGGLNLTLIEDVSILCSRARMMSPTGRCHSFDESADGYVRAEGGGIIVLKRLSDAQRNGDRILALIRGSALNQDGRSSGLTAPHGPAQEAVIRAALADSRVSPDDITFVEAHGTGTALGDPIEVNALSNVFAGRSPDRPVLIGSIKANIGHSESAAGVAGVIKAVQVLRHREIPRQIHLNKLNPMIAWDSAPVRVPLENTPLTLPPGVPLLCGVSSFGFSGTNAHLILQEAPPVAELAESPHAADASTVLAFSARNPDALAELAQRYVDLFEGEDAPSLRDAAANAPLARSHFAERAAVVAADGNEAAAALRSFANGELAPNIVKGRALSSSSPEIVFLFTGQGAQYAGMGKGLYETEPVFREALDACDRLARPHMDRSLRDVILGADGDVIDDTTYTQPALFALEYALAQTWRAWGIEPTAVMGHSVGEYTAACVAGMLSLEDAIRLIVLRGRLMGALPSGGAMAAAFATEDVVRTAMANDGGRVSVAGVNGPTNVVISGAAEAVDAVLEALKAKDVEVQRLNVSHAFHSALMDPILDDFEQAVSQARFQPPQITLISNVSGAPMGAEGLRPDYWRLHLREAVRFSDSIANLQTDGYRVFLEVGPAPVLSGMAQRCPQTEGAAYISSLRRGRDDRRSMLEAAGRLYAVGAQLNWPAIIGPRRHTSLPGYPFQRSSYWLRKIVKAPGPALTGTPTGHPLLGVRAATPLEIYQTQLGVSSPSWAKDHRIFDQTPFPAAGFLELALAAAISSSGPEAALENVSIGEGLMLPESGVVSAQVVVTPDAGGRKTVEVYSAIPVEVGQPVQWRLHVTATVASRGAPPEDAAPKGDDGFQPISIATYYDWLEKAGAQVGPTFRGISAMRRLGSEIVAETALPAGVNADGYLLHPALLDACIQAMGEAMDDEAAELSKDIYLPVGVRSYRVFRPGASAATCRVVVAPRSANAKSAEADITLFDATGAPIAQAIGFEAHRISRHAFERLTRKSNSETEWRFKIDWIRSVDGGEAADVAGQNWLVFADDKGVGDAFAGRLRRAGAAVQLLARPDVPNEQQIVAAIAKAAPIDQPLHGAVLLWPLDASADASDLAALEKAHADQLNGALLALRTVVDRAARVIVATRGSQQAVTASANLAQSPLWAFAGVVASEHPTCGLTRVDLDPTPTPRDADALVSEAGRTDQEDRVAYRGGVRYLARLDLDDTVPAPENEPVVLDITERGSLGNLALLPMERRLPGPGEVEVRVYATGLNFRDTLNALGMYQGEPGPLGNECAGVVTAVGSGVTRLALGDEVVTMADHCFATYVVAPENKTVIKPRTLTFQEAATVPVTFLTVDHALRALSGIKSGDRVLIHAVTGGVGMAAAQIALKAGAVVFGTAGSPAKRQMAKDMGVQFVSDSRSLSFVEDVMRETNGEGVDIVLNSLAGDFIPASLGLTRPGGAFVEIGATGVWATEAVAEAYPGIRYHTLYLGAVAAADPEGMRARLEGILKEMESGSLRPLPQTVFPLTRAESAFRYMGQGFHTGKIVITQPRPARIHADGAYVLTGGLTGLGLTTAQKLVEQGARGIVLLGRRAPAEDARKAIASMEASGAAVRAAQVDVGDVASLATLLDEVRAQMGPIRGVIHAAGILDDGMISELTPERFSVVMAPKVRGGWALHTLTLQDPLDFFVLFSSVASLLGSPGQGNYAAANGFLDGLANYRHARGLPALAINWGSWSGVGMAAGVGADHQRRWASMGLEMISPASGMDMLLQLVTTGAGPQVAATPIVRSKLPSTVGPFYRNLLVQNAAAVEVAAPVDMVAALKAVSGAERSSLLGALLSGQVLRVLALPADQRIDPHESLLNLGLDSLMAMELRNRLQSGFGVRVAVADLLGGADVNQLCQIIKSKLVFDATEENADEEDEFVL